MLCSAKKSPLSPNGLLTLAPEYSLVQLMAMTPGWFGSSHAVTVAAPQEGAFYGKRCLLGSQAHCGHAPGALGSHQSQETLRSPRLAAPTSIIPVTQPKHSHEQRWKKVERKSRWRERTCHSTPKNTLWKQSQYTQGRSGKKENTDIRIESK